MTSIRSPFRCFLIGADTLLIECAQQIMNNGHTILGVITDVPRIAQWAQDQGLETLSSSGDYGAQLEGREFEYFFSITHLEMVPEKVLAMPTCAAINFHDGPLPAYAGLNTPAWALINREREYGITFHEMVAGVDEGRILEAEYFTVAPAETSLSINTKCFEAAMRSFGRLLTGIEQDSLQPREQDLAQRSYFGKHQRPRALCSIIWTDLAEHIDALIHALDFGARYQNPLGYPKLKVGDTLYAVTSSSLVAEPNMGEPGEVLSITEEGVIVATGHGPIRLEGFARLCGMPLLPLLFVEATDIQVGSCFDAVDEETGDLLDGLAETLSRSEQAWVDQLAALEPLEIPLAEAVRPNDPVDFETLDLHLPQEFLARGAQDKLSADETTAAGIIAWLCRLVGARQHLAVTTAQTRDRMRDLGPWLNPFALLKPRFRSRKTWAAQLPRFARQMKTLNRRLGWTRDTAARHGATRALAGSLTGRFLPVCLNLGVDGEDFDGELACHGHVLNLFVDASGTRCQARYNPKALSASAVATLNQWLQTFLVHLAEQPDVALAGQHYLDGDDLHRITLKWNDTDTEIDEDLCINHLFERQVAATPGAPALAFEDDLLTYAELNAKANQLARELQSMGVGPESLVGVCVERSCELMIATIAIQKAGAAYVPLDPAFPKDRICYMVEDASAAVIITQAHLVPLLPKSETPRILMDLDAERFAGHDTGNLGLAQDPEMPAYIIYTSGSTGRPKGVVVKHHNAVNFFAGMDQRIPRDHGNTWLAVTSLSFDISVLELFWTLTRGFKVVIYRDRDKESAKGSRESQTRPMDFSVFLWGSDGDAGSNKYELMLEAARFADDNGFLAVWTPERHFHAFGGPYANPSVTASAIAATTKNVRVRSGSVVVPLHHPVRVTEEWSMVDNISGGRVDLGVAAGWQPDDFMLRPENHKNAREIMFESIDHIRGLWRGEKRGFPGPLGTDVEVVTQPRPIQDELNVWIAIAGNPDTFRRAGEIGAHVLTHLLGQSLDQVAENLVIYRRALVDAGFPEDHGKVTLMLHTFVGETDDEVRDIVRGPLKNFLGSSVHLAKKYAASFPTFRKPGGGSSLDNIDLDGLRPEDYDAVIEFSFLRYFETSGLLGSFERCMDTVNRCKEMGIDEIGCLLDFGVETSTILEALPALNKLKDKCNEYAVNLKTVRKPKPQGDYSLPALLRDHDVSHLQCTPSMARMISIGKESAAELAKVGCLMVGGEAFPVDLAADLRELMDGRIINMYGPTETTIWSSTYPIEAAEPTISIGTPIANTQLYVLDNHLNPAGPGVPGNLFIGGLGVVRGYYQRPSLTAERFIPDPFSSEGARIYFTGDQACYRADGLLDFLGRNDHQVKIRGYRIELGEIESLLAAQDSVAACVVMAREDVPGDQRIVAYMIAKAEEPKVEDLQEALRKDLPEYMVPSNFVFLKAFPQTPNGKIDRKALPAPDAAGKKDAAPYVAPENDLETLIAELWKKLLVLDNVGIDANFFDIGGHSLLLVQLHQELEQALDERIDLTALYQNPTIRSLAQHLASEDQGAGALAGLERAARRRQTAVAASAAAATVDVVDDDAHPYVSAPGDIAIVGMGIHVPGANTIDAYWDNLINSVESVTFLDDERLLEEGVSEHELRHPNYVRAGAFLEGRADFDAEFFGFSPKEAAIMDPQHRRFLEVCWEAVEDAGHPPHKFDGSVGVFGGCGMGTYMMYNLVTNRQLLNTVGYFLVRHTGNDKDFLSTRVSYCFNLNGPSINVQTACSTSLVAVHLGAQSLLSNECDMALAGGVTIETPHYRGYVFRENEILSPDGHCRAFDHRSKGTIFGSGAGAVVLRRMNDALADGDRIYAVIRGSAVNNDGNMKVGYLAPSVNGQAAAITEALAVANVPAESIDYVEAHGTGTPMGDPIEISALTQAYRNTTQKKGYCGIGSVKTNIGHLDTAAGVAGLIKTVMSLYHRKLPASLNWEAPNPAIDFASSPFYVNNETRDWAKGETPRRAAINSLGVGGTNAHIILEEAPRRKQTAATEGPYLFQLSARNKAALDASCAQLADFLSDNPETSLADVTHTLRQGRADFDKRRVFAASTHDEAVELLRSADPYRVFNHDAGTENAAVIFLMPGGGAQYLGMATELYESEPVFAKAMDACMDILLSKHELDLKTYLFPDQSQRDALVAAFERPSQQLPAIFAVEYALAQLWMDRGLQPRGLLGHSLGENTAACVAGVFSLEDGLGLVHLRGRLFETVPEGGMISVNASSDELRPLLGDNLVTAVENAPELCVISGPKEDLDKLSDTLAEREIEFTRIQINIAAHSPMLDGILDAFRAYLNGIQLNAPQIPFISNRTGDWITEEQATDPDYWVGHLRGRVHFASGLATLMREHPDALFLEVGPGSTLTSLTRLQPGFGSGHHVVTSLRHRKQEVADSTFFTTAQGRIWAAGLPLDASQLPKGQHISLPTYAFQHRTYWIEATPQDAHDPNAALLNRTENFDEWFYEPQWHLEPMLEKAPIEPCNWLVFTDAQGVGETLIAGLREAGHTVVVVHNGDRNKKLETHTYMVDSDRGAEGYQLLAAGLVADTIVPDRIVHMWMLTADDPNRPALNRSAHNLEQGFYSLFFMLRALSENDLLDQTHLITISNEARQVGNEPLLSPEKAAQDGPCKVVVNEFPSVTCTTIDVDYSMSSAKPRGILRNKPSAQALLIPLLAQELTAPAMNAALAYRKGTRYQLQYPRRPKLDAAKQIQGLRDGGTYLITGGLGGIGLTVAETMAREVRVNLLLISRTGLPARKQWDDWIAQHDKSDRARNIISQIRHLESLGATVEVGSVDVTDEEELSAFVAEAEERLGPVRGVIHGAGVISDSLIATKGIEEVENVFAPKVYGTMVLDMVFENHKLDFFILFSSSSTVTAPAGQVDYVAANAFLNAFAHGRAQRKGERCIALNWGVWNQVGIAAEATQSTISTEPAKHSLFREVRESKGVRWIGLAPLTPSGHWLLDEHRLKDNSALLPGTSYLELAHDALKELLDFNACEISNMQFVSPMAVAEGTVGRTRVKLETEDQGYLFQLQSLRQSVDGQSGWLTHAEGNIRVSLRDEAPQLTIASIQSRCDQSSQIARGPGLRTAQERHLNFGARWRVLRELHYGKDEALAKLALPEAFHSDLEDFALHPGLLDIATGCAMDLITGYNEATSVLWVPVNYGAVRIFKSLPAEIYSWIRNHSDNHVDNETASFDIVLTDLQGNTLVEIEQFTIQKTPRRDLLTALKSIPWAALEPDQDSQFSQQDAELTPAERALYHNVSQGIQVEEGMRAIGRIIQEYDGREIVISSLDLEALIEQSALISMPGEGEATTFERPQLNNDYVEPETDVEKQLVEQWQEMLGIETVGTADSFFELGGHSLIAVRMFAKIKKTWGLSLPVGTLFEAPTIGDLAKMIDTDGSASSKKKTTRDSGEWSHLVPIQPEGDKPPVFCVAGKGGNPMNLRHLAARLDADQPFYGIQHRGVDGAHAPHESLKEMAASCIKDVQKLQPHGPYLLSGFSGGGLVIFEMAHQLKEMGEEVALIALFDTPSPARMEFGARERLSLHLKNLKRQGSSYIVSRLKRRFTNQEHNKKPAALTALLNTDEEEPLENDPGVAVANAWTRMEETYKPDPLDNRAILFRPYMKDDEFDFFLAGDEFNGWGGFLKQGVEIVELPGGHNTMCEEPHVRIFAKRFTKAIESALS